MITRTVPMIRVPMIRLKAYEGDARAIVYCSGHGMPSEDGHMK